MVSSTHRGGWGSAVQGLGFKVVFLADMARRFNLRDSAPALVVDDQLGVAMNVVDLERATTHPSFEKKMLAAKNRSETLSEEVRLLYVALTRAIDRLYLVATFSEKALEKWQGERGKTRAETASFSSQSCYRDWLGTCLCDPRHPLSLDAPTPLYKWRFVAADAEEAPTDDGTQSDFQALLDRADDALVAEIARGFSCDYAYAEATTQPFKRTVSQLTKSNRVIPDYIQDWPAYGESVSAPRADVPVPEFVQACLDEKLAVIPGSAFYVDASAPCQGVRLNFSTPSEDAIRRGVDIMARVLRKLFGQSVCSV